MFSFMGDGSRDVNAGEKDKDERLDQGREDRQVRILHGTESGQPLLRRRQLMWGSNLFHVGILVIFAVPRFVRRELAA